MINLKDLKNNCVESPTALRDRVLAETAQLLADSDLDAAKRNLRRLEWATVDEHTIDQVDQLMQSGLLGECQIIATCDTARRAARGELVVVYGNYPYSFANLLVNDVARRHVSWFWKIPHHQVEYDQSWESIDQIYIINVDRRQDRLDAVLTELARAKAPLHRITRVPAVEIKPPSLTQALVSRISRRMSAAYQIGSTVGCLKSHIEVLRQVRKSNQRNVLVLEDDFCFTSDLDVHLRDLLNFFKRRYDYWICLLATSKYGLIVELDDLVSYSLQPCTNAGAYLVSSDGVDQLLPLWTEALDKLIRTKGRAYAADRAWSELQSSGKFLVFRRKMGFQASSFSDIEQTIARYFD